MTNKSKRMQALDYVWEEVGNIVGLSTLTPDADQQALADTLQALCDAPLSSSAIYDLANAIKLSWLIGLKAK